MTSPGRCMLVWLSLLAPLQAAAEPYVNHRDAELGYHGPSEDFDDLTELRLGWFGPADANDPLTGDLWWAANLAIEEANTPPPVAEHPSSLAPRLSPQLPFRLIPRWSVDPWGTGVSQLTRMVYDEQPLALLGSIDSASTHLAEQVVAKANLALVSPFATDPTITLAGVPWMFSCAPSDSAIARVLVEGLLAHVSGSAAPGPLLLLSTTDHESRMTTREVVRELSQRGHLPDFRLDLPAGALDVSAHLGPVAARTPAAILIIAGIEDAARMVQAARATFGGVAIFGGPSMSRTHFLKLAGPAADGVRVPLLWSPSGAAASTTDFVARFTAARGHLPDYTDMLTYDATRLLVAAIRQAGPNRARIRQALIELSPWSGVGGAIDFDGTGQNTRADLRLGVVRDGAITPAQPNPGLLTTTTPSTAP